MSLSKSIRKKLDVLCQNNRFMFKLRADIGYILIITGLKKNTNRHWFINRSVKVAYLTIAKAANTSIKNSIISLTSLDDSYKIHRIKDYEEFYASNLEKEKIDFSFSFVRNPFDRLYSAYISKYKKDKIILEKDKLAFPYPCLVYDFYLFGLMRKDKGFSTYVKYVCKIPDRIADSHFCSQYNVLYKNNKPLVDYIGHFETLDEEYKPIQEKYGFKPLLHANKSEHGSWMDQYTIEMAEKVYKRYKKDFEAFGYEESYHELIEYIKNKEGINAENRTIGK